MIAVRQTVSLSACDEEGNPLYQELESGTPDRPGADARGINEEGREPARTDSQTAGED